LIRKKLILKLCPQQDLVKLEIDDQKKPAIASDPDPSVATTGAANVPDPVDTPAVKIHDSEPGTSSCTFEDLLEKYSSGLITKTSDTADPNLNLLNSASPGHGLPGSCHEKELDDFELLSGYFIFNLCCLIIFLYG